MSDCDEFGVQAYIFVLGTLTGNTMSTHVENCAMLGGTNESSKQTLVVMAQHSRAFTCDPLRDLAS